MFISKKQTNKYPFTSASSLELSPGVFVGAGVFMSAMFSPRCEQTDYAYISYIGRENNSIGYGKIEISSAEGEVIASAKNISVGSVAEYNSVSLIDINDTYCGSITFGLELRSVLQGSYSPSNSAFVFTPSVFRPIAYETGASLLYNGEPVESVLFSGGSISGGTVGVLSIPSRDIAGQFDAINCIVLEGGKAEIEGVEHTNAVSLGGSGTKARSVNILPYTQMTTTPGGGTQYSYIGSCVRVVNTGSEIKVGTLEDVRK